jgi:hypothetical protein
VTRKYLVSEERKRRIKEIDEKRKADQLAEDEAVERLIQLSIEKHGP